MLPSESSPKIVEDSQTRSVNAHTLGETYRPDKSNQKTLLLAYDGSQHAQAAVNLLSDLPLSGSDLTIVAVMPTQFVSDHERLQDNLEVVKEKLSAFGLNVDTQLKAGNPAAAINDYAVEIDADLIVIGAKGLRATLGIWLGGVAQQVVEYSCCPILVVRSPYNGLKRILIVTDGSEYSQKMLDYMAPLCSSVSTFKDKKVRPDQEFIRQRCIWMPKEAQIHLMHVLPPPISLEAATRAWTVGPEVLYPTPAPPIDVQSIQAEEELHGDQILSEGQGVLQAAGINPINAMPRGDAATEIIEYAKAKEIDLIVCGSRGLSQVAGWLLGSVSRKLVHYAGCSVLIVK